MAVKKILVEFDVQEDLVKMLEYATEKYKLGDKSKALRCLLEFAAIDGDWDVLFKQIRCIRCGVRTQLVANFVRKSLTNFVGGGVNKLSPYC